MFEIEYKGGNTIQVVSKKTTIIIDPKQSVVGLKDISVSNAVQLATEGRFRVESDDYRLTFDGPGEYEVGDVAIRGVAARRHIDSAEDARKESTIYRLVIGDVRIAVFGNVAENISEDQLEKVGIIDIAIIPVGGGGYTLDATSASGLIRQIEPRVVIPVHFDDKSLKYEVPQDELSQFTNELGAPVEEVGKKYKLKSSSSLPQTLTVITIERS